MLGQPAGDHLVIGSGFGKGFFGQLPSCCGINRAVLPQRGGQLVIIVRIGDHSNKRMVFCRRADHGWPANIDILNRCFKIRTSSDGLGKRVQIGNNHINRANGVFIQRGHMGLLIASGQNAAMNMRMQGFDPPVHNFRKPCH